MNGLPWEDEGGGAKRELNKTSAAGQRELGWIVPCGIVGGLNKGWIKHLCKE